MSLSRIIISLPEITLTKEELSTYRKLYYKVVDEKNIGDRDTLGFHSALSNELFANEDVKIKSETINAILDLFYKMGEIIKWYKQLNNEWFSLKHKNLATVDDRLPI